MRSRPLIVASLTALLTLPGAQALQQNNSQSVPDAPQPQKKPAPKPEPAPPAAPKPAQDDNPFPEDVSKQAAKAASAPSDADPAKPSTRDANPFPEAVSRDAARAAGKDETPETRRDLPPGVSSSQSSGTDDTSPRELDPARAKKDTEVGGFYLKTGDYRGALVRYQEATASDPTNVEAIFGLAETQRMLKNNAEAARNYQLYLEIVPNGPKARQALKALKTVH